MHRPPLAMLTLALLSSCPAGAFAAAGQAGTSGAAVHSGTALVDYSLEQLADIVVTSVSREETRLGDAPASIYLITAADIRRSGATTLPEALRLAPNLQVAQSDSRSYAITARGFSSVIENKLLVMIDGRSVYSPLFSGVFWDAQDVMLDDVDRIEVISGPGATIWGANAVNGVINIITRSARETQGGLLAAGVGERGRDAGARYGAALANGGAWRAYAKVTDEAATTSEKGGPARTSWRRRIAGLRADMDAGGFALTVSGGVYDGTLGQVVGGDILISGAHLLASATRQLGDGDSQRLQAWIDHSERNIPGAGAQVLDMADLEFQQSSRFGEHHRLAWGGGYRYGWDRVQDGTLIFTPAERHLHWANVFAQDEISLAADVRLTAGLKLEHNLYTGLEYLPNVRLAYTPSRGRLWWTSLSRTVRAPSRIDRDLMVIDQRNSTPGHVRYSIAGGPDFESETANVFEAGYRGQPREDLAYAVTAFYSEYDRLRTLEPVAGVGNVFSNFGRGETFGMESWARWQPTRNWRLAGGLVLQNIRTRLKPGSLDASGSSGLVTNDPSHYWSLRSAHELSDALQADFNLRYMGALPRPAVPSYTELDARLAWQARRNLEVALVGQNLLHAYHAEFGTPGFRQRIERNLALRLAVKF